MDQTMEKVEVAIEELKESVPSEDGSGVVLETAATIDGERRDTSIEVQQEDVPAVAVALLNTEGGVNVGEGDTLPPIKCLGAGVVDGLGEGRVRFHLQFDSGQVLPIEMSRDAALALCRGLFQHTGAAVDFDPVKWSQAMPFQRPVSPA